ncbi:hypothetical protein [Streptomyces sp. NPDC005485]|uniref:hypothetical protein n=1 Tax=Streptomyces sp. NPDC005485 TaxID=3155591 RepID=UPI0033BD3122
MSLFEAHLREAAVGILKRFPEELRQETYVLSFRIWRTDDDCRRPYVAIGYNTESQYERESYPEDPGEARWNYAYWLLEGFETLGNVPEDPEGSRLYVEEVRQLGLWYEGYDDEFELPDDLPEAEQKEIDGKDDLLGLHFSGACIALARHLHAEGHIERIFGRPLPVVVFDMYAPGWEIAATEAANPPEVITDFLAWQHAAVYENAPRTGEFLLRLDEEWLDYFREIADVLVERFGISRAEAVARINEAYAAEELQPMGQDLLGHELPEFWAHRLYFRPDARGLFPSGDPTADGDLARWDVRPAPRRDSAAWTLTDETPRS